MTQSQTTTVDVPYIYDEHTFGKVPLKINLRQSSSSTFSFVTITEAEDRSVIHIDTVGVQPGDYELKLESYDSEGRIQATSKTDTITITVKHLLELTL